MRRAIHSLLVLFPQGFRSTLANSKILTLIFEYFDAARYIQLQATEAEPARQVCVPENPEPLHIPITEYVYIEPECSAEIATELADFPLQPLISIIMPVFNTDPQWLRLAVQSIKKQWYRNWELCITDDHSTNPGTIAYLQSLHSPKIRIHFLPENLGISAASNHALTLASGTYVALLDHDDELTPDALYEAVKAINAQAVEFIYSDEDKLTTDGTFVEPHFKPDYSPDMFFSQNYLSHLGIIHKALLDKVGGFKTGLEGAQDYDLYLKVLEHTDKVVHIPKVLYHWRMVPGSTAAVFKDKSFAQDAGALALRGAIQRRNLAAEVINGKYAGTYRVKYHIKRQPLISIIVPFRDKPELLAMCYGSILEKSTYQNFELIGISNNSEQQETLAEMQRLTALDSRVSFHQYNVPFNFSRINNHAVRTHANGEHILLLNNDIEIITPNWLECLLEFSQRADVGAVGAKLYYPDGSVQHAGIIIGIGGIAGHSHKYLDGDKHGYFSRPHLVQNLSAVTGACLMLKRDIFDQLGGLNAINLKIAFNDVDFCLRIRQKGYLNVFTPYAEAYHHESVSRGLEATKKQQHRFNREIAYMSRQHADLLKRGDPYYNHALTLDHEDFSLAAKPP